MTINVPNNEKMELVYLYVEKANGEEYDLHLDFSRDIQIRWDKDKKEFSIKELDNSLPKFFFGNNITNVTAIAGKNGIGKTTIINFLSSIDRGWSDDSAWILIIKSEGGFCIEGNIVDILDEEMFRRYYSAYGMIGTSFFNEKFLQDTQMRKDLCFLDLEEKREQEATSHTFFQRFFVNKSLYSDVYSFLISEHSRKNFLLYKKHHLSISLSDVSFIDDAMEKEPKMEIYLVSNERALLALMKKYWKRSIFPIDQSQKIQNFQQEFLLTFCRFIFDSLFNFMLFLRNNAISSLKDIEKIGINDKFAKKDRIRLRKYIKVYNLLVKRIVTDFSEDRSLYDIPLLQKYINELLIFLDADFPDYIPGVTKAYMVKNVFSFDQIFKIFSSLTEKYFISRNTITFTDFIFIEGIDQEQLIDLLNECDLWNYKYQISSASMECSFGDFSAGEMQLINMFSSINSKLEQIRTDGYKYIILMLDEYELHLHPEWSRQFLNNLLSVLNTYKMRFQLLLTTHSPYLISDLPKENIILLEKDEKTGKRTARKSNYGFASNYYDIMSDSFFLDDTIGEFAKQKINGWLNEIKKIQISKKSFEDKNKKLDQLKENLSIIGDEFLRNELMKQINIVKDNVFNEISNEDKIAFYRKQISELEKKEYHD